MTGKLENRSVDLGIACEILTTKNLILRPPHEDDAEDIAMLANNENVASMLEAMPYPYKDTDAHEFIKKMSSPQTGGCTYAITHAESGQLMGICGLRTPDERRGLHSIGYWLGEEFWGKGYATQAARALVDLFFKVGEEDVLLISVLTNNSASRRVIEKCGGRYWKQEMISSTFFGEDRPVDRYRITRENWMGAVAA